MSFTLGVSVICFAEYLLLRHPGLFPIFYYCLMPVLFIMVCQKYFWFAVLMWKNLNGFFDFLAEILWVRRHQIWALHDWFLLLHKLQRDASNCFLSGQFGMVSGVNWKIFSKLSLFLLSQCLVYDRKIFLVCKLHFEYIKYLRWRSN